MGPLMASKDTAHEINEIKLRLGLSEQSIDRQERTLERCVDILAQVVTVAEKQNFMQQQLDEFREHSNNEFAKFDARIEKNSRQVLMWTGGIGSLLTAIAVLSQLGLFK